MKSPPDKPYRLMIADDHDVLRLGLRNLISRDPGFTVVDEAASGQELLDKLEKQTCDLIILDLSMPGLNGIQVLERLGSRFPRLKVLIFSMHKEKEFFRHVMRKNVDGYILKDDNFDQILHALREIRDGRKSFSADLVESLYVEQDEQGNDAHGNERISLEILTRREKDILRRIAAGATNRQIADDLDISPRTVQTHRSNIMEKLHIKNTAGLVKFAMNSGLME
ncbi:MAG: response regulator transcription factor [Leptospiraceae bacterium]|nr:response regulator transcription factor [Leptospiraceae bacterium]